MIDVTVQGARVLRPEGFDDAPLRLSNGVIGQGVGPRVLDLSEYWVLPGIVDLHGDGFERHLAPRRGAMRDLSVGLASAEVELAANGITTAVLAQFWSWEGGMRGPDFALRFLETLQGFDGLGVDMLAQLRVETHLIEDFPRIEDAVAQFRVPYLVFNDHLPHAALEKGKKPPRLTGQALKSGRSPEAHLALLHSLHALGPQVPAAVAGLASRLVIQGTRLGSHDDRDEAERATLRALGARIAEFPESEEAAVAAHMAGDAVVMGAPNVVRGGSHSGNVAAADLIGRGAVDALASDYHYPAPLQAVFRLIDDGICSFEAAWALVSDGPARVLGLNDRGTLTSGARADLIVLDPVSRRVVTTICAGRIVYMAGPVVERWVGENF